MVKLNMSFCLFPECSHPLYAKNFCKFHYRQNLYHIKLTPNTHQLKYCHCRLPLDAKNKCPVHYEKCDYCERSAVVRGYCQTHYKRKRSGDGDIAREIKTFEVHANNPCKITWCDDLNYQRGYCRTHLRVAKHHPKLSSSMASKILEKNECEICGQTEGILHIDHDHSIHDEVGACDECVRGLLCNSCNTGLGMFGDDVTKMQLAIGYLHVKART